MDLHITREHIATFPAPALLRPWKLTYSKIEIWAVRIILAYVGITDNWCLCYVYVCCPLLESKIMRRICIFLPQKKNPMIIFTLIMLLQNSFAIRLDAFQSSCETCKLHTKDNCRIFLALSHEIANQLYRELRNSVLSWLPDLL